MSYQPRRSIVTGASSGIGAEFARALAARGSDLVLVARRTDRLRALASELEAAHGIRAEVVTADLSKPGAGRALRAELDGTIDTLVNNAGFGAHGPVAEEDPETLERLVAVDVTAVVDLTRAFLPELLEAGHGAIVTIASTAGFQPVPLMAAYGAAKAFVLSFSQALWQECRPHGVKVLALAPGFTTTEFFDVAGNADSAHGAEQTPAQVVATGMRALDRRRTPPYAVSGLVNAAGAALSPIAPRRLTLATVERMMRLRA
ncbi:MAG TPA: SDR family oxidoreductase [Pseudolysinimonas sp.]|nr:SDR family oxidoreductase [Pseudolysinimonas sp.]